MKKISVMLLVILMMTATLSSVTLASEMPLRIVVNKDEMRFFDAQPFKDEQGRIQVPLRFVTKALGAEVNWDHESGEAKVQMVGKTIIFTLGKEEYTINGEIKKMDTKALMKDTRVFVPVRYAVESLGATLNWEESTNTVYIDTRTISDTIDWSKPWTEEYYGFVVTQNTGSMLGISKGHYDEIGGDHAILSLTINFGKKGANYDMQVKEVEEILQQKIDEKAVEEIMKYVKKKTEVEQELKFKEFTDDTYKVLVVSRPYNEIGVTIYYK
jgi:Copper amine oxidase N-terminal domain